MGIATHDREGDPIRDLKNLTAYRLRNMSWSPWQAKHWAPHLYLCACGKAFPDTHGLGTHVSAHRRHRNPGHGSMERVGYPVTLNK